MRGECIELSRRRGSFSLEVVPDALRSLGGHMVHANGAGLSETPAPAHALVVLLE